MLRRDFLKAGIGLGGLGILTSLPVAAANKPATLFSCRADNRGQYFISGLSPAGQRQFDIALPGRGHGVQLHPGRPELIVFSRRPGAFLWVIDINTGQVSYRIDSPTARHFYGHGAFSADGRYLFTSENDFANVRGVIAVYDSKDHYRRIEEFDSHGIGPHELIRLNNSNALAVANGGIQTHPDFQRSKLNLDTMDPNLAYIDIDNGQLLDAYRPPEALHQLSIRHLSATRDDQVCIAMQYQGAANEHPPLIATHQGEDQLQFIDLPAELNTSLKNYCGSVCTDPADQWFAVSAPRGNRIVFLSTRDRSTTSVTLKDGCGIASGTQPGEFLLSSGNGSLLRYRVNGDSSTLLAPDIQVKWDNHMLASQA